VYFVKTIAAVFSLDRHRQLGAVRFDFALAPTEYRVERKHVVQWREFVATAKLKRVVSTPE